MVSVAFKTAFNDLRPTLKAVESFTPSHCIALYPKSEKAASKTALRLLRVAILSSIFSTLLFHHTFQDTWIITNDDYESLLAPHLRSDSNGGGAIIKKDGLSACLLVNDENPRLPEWLAYHYHVLPLRSIIVAVDPASRYRPNEILKRWVPMGMKVDVWEDVDYLGNRGGVW
jgi:hypothetical protein